MNRVKRRVASHRRRMADDAMRISKIETNRTEARKNKSESVMTLGSKLLEVLYNAKNKMSSVIGGLLESSAIGRQEPTLGPGGLDRSPRGGSRAGHQRVMLGEHRPPRGQRDSGPDPHPGEKAIVAAVPELADYVVGLKQRSRKAGTLALRQRLCLVREYPREPVLGAVREAGRYGRTGTTAD